MLTFYYKRSGILLSILACGFYGCSPRDKKGERASLIEIPSAELALFQAREGANFKDSWPEKKWWHLFGDEQLNILVEKVLSHNQTIQKSIATLGEAKAKANKEKSKLLPMFYFTFSDGWEFFSQNNLLNTFAPGLVPPSLNNIDMFFNLNYDFDLFGKNKKLYRAALGEAKAQEAETSHVQLLATVACVSAYFSWQCDTKRLELLEKLSSLREKIIDLKQKRTLNGVDSDLEDTQARYQKETLEKLIHSTQNQIDLDRHLILTYMGESADKSLALLSNDLPLNKMIPLPSYLSLELLSRRADLMAEIWRLEAAAQEIGAAKAAFYPNLNLMAFAGLNSVYWNKLFSSSSKDFGVDPAFTLPIFMGGVLRANLKLKQKAFDAAVYSYNQRILNAIKEVMDQLSSLLTHQKNLLSQEKRVDLNEHTSLLTQDRVEHGLDTAISFYEAEEEELFQKLELLQIKQQALLTTARLIQALGGGFHNTSKEPTLRDYHEPKS